MTDFLKINVKSSPEGNLREGGSVKKIDCIQYPGCEHSKMKKIIAIFCWVIFDSVCNCKHLGCSLVGSCVIMADFKV